MKRVFVVVAVAAFMGVLLPAAFAQRFSEWSVPVRLDWGVNTDWADMSPVITRDGLTLYFSRGSTPGGGQPPIYTYVTHRASVDAPWGTPLFLGERLGGGLFLSTDGHRAYFSRTEADGTTDIYMSRRQDQNDDFGWGPAVSLASPINTPANEQYPALYEDQATGNTMLYFTSDRGGTEDIYVSTLRQDGSFSDPVPVVELNSTAVDRQMHVRRDGLECVFTSNRPGSMPNAQGKPSYDLWVATRLSTSDSWLAPVNMGGGINTGRFEAAPYYSFDGSQLYFHGAQRPGNFDIAGGPPEACPTSATCYFDILMVTREKVDGRQRP